MKMSISKNGAILGAFAFVTTALIALTHFVTAPVIEEQKLQQKLAILNSILPTGSFNNNIQHNCTLVQDTALLGDDKPKRVYRAYLDDQPAGLAIETTAPNGYSGRIELIVGVLADGTVGGVRVIEHNETPGLGDKIDLRVSNWILSFSGKHYGSENQQDWRVKKDGGQFDQFTGATITPRAVVGAVRHTLDYVQQHQAEIFAASNQCEATQ